MRPHARARGAAAATFTFALGALAVAVPPASGHGETQEEVRTVVLGSEPPMPDVSVRTVTSTSTALELVNRGPRTVEVLSGRARPFLRIGPRGVEADVNSTDWYASGNPEGVVNPPPGARVGAAPRWERVARVPAWTWFDHRLHPTRIEVPADAAARSERRRLADWTVPVRYDGRAAEIRGYVEFRPVTGAIAPTLTDPSPVSGVVAAALPGRVPGVFLDASGTRAAVTVHGSAGEPFLRFDARGVRANLRSPSHHADRRLRGQPVDVPADPDATARWRRVTEDPRYGWLEPRARYPAEEPPRAVAEARRRTALVAWTIPLEVARGASRRREALRGTTSWVPLTSPSTAEGAGRRRSGPPVLAVAALSVLTVGAVAGLAWAARRSRGGAALE